MYVFKCSLCVFSFEIQAQTQSYEENFTEEDLQLIQERESAIRQLEVRLIQRTTNLTSDKHVANVIQFE